MKKTLFLFFVSVVIISSCKKDSFLNSLQGKWKSNCACDSTCFKFSGDSIYKSSPPDTSHYVYWGYIIGSTAHIPSNILTYPVNGAPEHTFPITFSADGQQLFIGITSATCADSSVCSNYSLHRVN